MKLAGADGLELAVDAAGDGAPLLFVHGFSNDREVWCDVAAGLELPLRRIRFDLRGHGDSDWSLAGRYAPDDHARDIECVLDGLDIERTWLVGHSLGGNAATLFAAAHPDRIVGLVLVDTGPVLSDAAWSRTSSDVSRSAQCFAEIADYRRLLGLAYPMGQPEALDRMARSGLVRRIDGRFEPKLDPMLFELSATAGEQQQLEDSLWAALGKIQCPTLVVRGAQSAMLPAEVARTMVAEVLPQGRLEQVDAAGHAVAVDNPDALARAIRDFVAQPGF